MIIKGQRLTRVASHQPSWLDDEEDFVLPQEDHFEPEESLAHVPRQKASAHQPEETTPAAMPKRRVLKPMPEDPSVSHHRHKAAIQPELDKMRAAAHTQGYETGYADAQKELKQLRTLLEELSGLKQTVLLASADAISTMVLEVAAHILQHELETTPKQVEQYVRKAIKASAKNQKYITVRLHPADVDTLQAVFDENSPVKRTTEFQLEPDNSVDRGSCIIETDAGQVDRRFSIQFEILKKAFEQLPKLTQTDLKQVDEPDEVTNDTEEDA